MTESNLLQEALRYYDIAVDTVKRVDLQYSKITRQKHRSEELLKKFDLFLQSLLLNATMQRGVCCSAQMQFIESMAIYADLLSCYRAQTNTCVSWERAVDIPQDPRLKEFAVHKIESFLTEFSMLQTMVKVPARADYFEVIRECVFGICVYLERISGDDCWNNTDTVAETVVDALRQDWLAAKQTAEENSAAAALR